MIYITRKQKQTEYQVSWEDILLNRAPINLLNAGNGASSTVTRLIEKKNIQEYLDKVNIPLIIAKLRQFNESTKHLTSVNRASLYNTFYIPKHSGGLRRIDAPNDELMNALRLLKTIFEEDFGALYHTSAFAYIKGRNTVDAIKKHQINQSNWFLKTDFSQFFQSTNKEFVIRMLKQIFPFSEVYQTREGQIELDKALDLCFLNGGLPQGTPISPMLTNIIMIPIDHEIFNELAKHRYVYTRYADDMLISCIQSFNKDKMVKYIRSVLKKYQAPFDIKNEKTRYGSRKGANWNLGLMLNKDNEITVGHMKKKQFKAALCNLVLDTKNNKRWDISDVEELNGTLSYYKMIEPDYFNYVIQHLNEKFHIDTIQIIREYLYP